MSGGARSWWQTRWGIALVCFLGVSGFFLLTEHAAHVFGVLPYLLLLACPLMHAFMHRGQHGGRHSDETGHMVHDRRPDDRLGRGQ